MKRCKASIESRKIVSLYLELHHPSVPLYVHQIAKLLNLTEGQVEDAFRILNQKGLLTQRDTWLHTACPQYWKIEKGWNRGKLLVDIRY